MGPEELYIALGRVIEDQPDPMDTNECLRWLGRARALVEKNSTYDASEISAATSFRFTNDRMVVLETANAALYRALAVAELNAPVSAQGSFIQAGNALDAMASMAKVLQRARDELLIVDPYMDEKTLIDFCPLAAEGVKIELLTDQATAKPTFLPALGRFKQQFGSTRPIDARSAAPRVLHDRLIVIDQDQVYSVTQSFNALASRSPASIIRVDAETAALKVGAYRDIWASATPV